MGKLYLGFDAGTQSVKVAVYDNSWTKVASHSLPTTLGYPNPGWVQMDADEYVANTVTCMKACSDELRRKGYDPAEATPESQRKMYGFLMRKGFRMEDVLAAMRMEQF